jgi:hypothetical protein
MACQLPGISRAAPRTTDAKKRCFDLLISDELKCYIFTD